jgi:hypothetical protein
MDIELMLLGVSNLVRAWYTWGGFGVAFVGLLVALLAAFWIFYNASRQGQDATLWKVLSIVAVILTIPSIVFRLSPSLAIQRFPNAVTPVAYLGLAGAVLALLSLVLYVAGVAMAPARTCPQCGRALDPSWDRCPYCEKPEPEPAPVTAQPEEMTKPLEPVAPEPGFQRKEGETRILEPPPPQLAYLIVTSGPRTGKEFRLGQTTTIGRDATQSDVVLEDTAVSRQHTKIKLEGKRFVVYDLGSTNHTYVNDREVYRQALTNGDKIRLGASSFTFIEVEEKKEEVKKKPARRRANKSQEKESTPGTS